jgi:hypothetical protein
MVLLAVQATLVLATAGKYLWERHTRPMVWARTQVFNEQALPFTAHDPEDRYFGVQLMADACGLPPRPSEQEPDFNVVPENQFVQKSHPVRNDRVRTAAKDGKLTVVEAEGVNTSDTQQIQWDLRKPCTAVRLLDIVTFYVPAGSAMPTQLKPGETVWALVTVPKQGPPRPVELAVSDAKGFHPLGTK